MARYNRRHDPLSLRQEVLSYPNRVDHYSPSPPSFRAHSCDPGDRDHSIHDALRSRTASRSCTVLRESSFHKRDTAESLSIKNRAPTSHPATGPVRGRRRSPAYSSHRSSSNYSCASNHVFQGLDEFKSCSLSREQFSTGMIIRAAHHEADCRDNPGSVPPSDDAQSVETTHSRAYSKLRWYIVLALFADK